MKRLFLPTLLVFAAAMGLASLATGAPGDLTFRNCISGDAEAVPPCLSAPKTGTGGAASGLEEVRDIAISPDGRSVYATSFQDAALARFARDPVTGVLRFDECITGDATVGPAGSGACRAIPKTTANGANSGLLNAQGVGVAAGNRDIYVSSPGDDAVARFRFNPADGRLSYVGCQTTKPQAGPAGTGACAALPTLGPNAPGLEEPEELTLSRDGRDLYVTSEDGSSISRFRRAEAGGLTWAGCISGDSTTGPTGSGACALVPKAQLGGNGSGLAEPYGIDISPDGRSLYVVHNDQGIAWLRRNPGTGALTWQGCISGNIDLGPGGTDACSLTPSAAASGIGSGLSAVFQLDVSPDGRSVYTAGRNDSSLVRFTRNQTTGALTFAGCFTGDTEIGPAPGSGACTLVPGAATNGTGSSLRAPFGVAVSGDARSVYVGGQTGNLVTFRRNALTGGVTFLRCITGDEQAGPAPVGSGACAAAPDTDFSGADTGFDGLESVLVSPEGRSVYAGSRGDAGIVTFRRELATCRGQAGTIAGTPGRDLIQGTRRVDVILALAGNDVVRGGRANDIVCGGPGREKLFGNRGNDTLTGGAGPDTLIGGPGRDLLAGGPGNDTCRGGPGRDRTRSC